MNQYLTDIGLASIQDFNARIGALSSGWTPNTSRLHLDNWIAGLMEPDVPVLRDTLDQFAELLENLSGGLVPDLVEDSMSETSHVPPVRPQRPLTGLKTAAAGKSYSERTRQHTTPEIPSSDTFFAAIEERKPDAGIQRNSVKGETPFTAYPAFDSTIPEPSEHPLNAPHPKQTFPATYPTNGDELNIQQNDPPNVLGHESTVARHYHTCSQPKPFALSPSPPSDEQEFRPLGKLSDMGNYQKAPPPQLTPQIFSNPEESDLPMDMFNPGEKGREEANTGNPKSMSFYTTSNAPNQSTPSDQNKTATIGTSKHTSHSLRKEEQPEILDMDTLMEELTRKLHDEYQRFYGD